MSARHPTPDYGEHFGSLAARYDELRPQDPSHSVIEAFVREGDLRGRSVLDVGCGTGRVAAVLAERYNATVSGLDPSPEMLEVARARGVVALKQGKAENIPFPESSFERALMLLVVHLVDRPRALAELCRVLVPGGRLVISTINPSSVDGFWWSGLFPSYEAIDRERFPAPDLLSTELQAAGFSGVRTVLFGERVILAREQALRMLRGRFASWSALIDDGEYRMGLDRAERELPERIESEIGWAIVTARVEVYG